jgi:hypothetical protein
MEQGVEGKCIAGLLAVVTTGIISTGDITWRV